MTPPAIELPLVTALLPGCGGRIKSEPEDFRVEEIPAYDPSGSGEHLYLSVEKRGVPTMAVVEKFAHRLGLPLHAVGYAGLKDAQAVTTQWISLHTPLDPESGVLDSERWRVLKQTRHGNKLRPGHLHGNRFDIRVREVGETSAVREILARIEARGFPNYFGAQRFGRQGDNAARGRAILLGGEKSRVSLSRGRLMVNAYQAELFNRILGGRLTELGDLGKILTGDLAVLHRNGASFFATEANLLDNQARADAGELSASAPLFGYRVSLAEGLPGTWETGLLSHEGLTLESFRPGGKRESPKGERRPIRIIPQSVEFDVEARGALTDLRLRFTLPPGTYATSLLREVMKTGSGQPAD